MIFSRFTTSRTLIFAPLVALFFYSSDSRADFTNYQPYVIGERALGMAGAYTAAVEDSMAVYYNPGGMVFASGSMVSASQKVYSQYYRVVKEGFIPDSRRALLEGGDGVDAKTLSHVSEFNFPSTLAFMINFGPRIHRGGPKRHAMAFSILWPYQDSFMLKTKWRSGGERGSDAETYSVSESFQSMWIGGSYGYRLNRRWGFGLSIFMADNRWTRRLDRSRFQDETGMEGCAVPECGNLATTESITQADYVALILRFGLLWAPKGPWRFGLTLTPPSILVDTAGLFTTRGHLDQTFGRAEVKGGAEDYIDYYTDDYNLEVAGYEPASVRLGAAYIPNDDLTLDLDVSFHFPISYHLIRGDPVALRYQGDPAASPRWFDNGIVRKIERLPVANVNLGGEWSIDNHWTVRGGIFTDFSSAPDVEFSRSPQLTKVNRVGSTLSISFRDKGYDITLGMSGSFGYGQASVYRPESVRGPDAAPWEPATYMDRTLYVFVAGVQKAVSKKAQELVQKASEQQRIRRYKKRSADDDREDEEEGG